MSNGSSRGKMLAAEASTASEPVTDGTPDFLRGNGVGLLSVRRNGVRPETRAVSARYLLMTDIFPYSAGNSGSNGRGY